MRLTRLLRCASDAVEDWNPSYQTRCYHSCYYTRDAAPQRAEVGERTRQLLLPIESATHCWRPSGDDSRLISALWRELR